MKKLTILPVAALLILALLAGCLPQQAPSTPAAEPTLDPDAPVSSDDPTPEPGPTLDPDKFTLGENAYIEELDVLILESFPVQARLVIRGQLPDGCTTIHEILPEREGQVFTVRVITARPVDAACTEALVPFEESVALDVYGLEAGEYTVRVGDQETSFRLDVDNVLPTP